MGATLVLAHGPFVMTTRSPPLGRGLRPFDLWHCSRSRTELYEAQEAQEHFCLLAAAATKSPLVAGKHSEVPAASTAEAPRAYKQAWSAAGLPNVLHPH